MVLMYLMALLCVLGKRMVNAIKICNKVVIFRAMELYNGIMYGVTEEGSGLSVLRTFRLLRILKLVRFLPNLRRQLIVMLKTMDNVAVFFGLLALFIFIFRSEALRLTFIDPFLILEIVQYSWNESLWMQVLRSGDWSLRQKKL